MRGKLWCPPPITSFCRPSRTATTPFAAGSGKECARGFSPPRSVCQRDLCISWVEGHRDPRLQEQYFNNYRERLASLDQSLSDEDLYLLASRYVSPPTIAPHVSGAAIDLTLCDEDGHELDMGTAVNATPEDSDGACYFGAR